MDNFVNFLNDADKSTTLRYEVLSVIEAGKAVIKDAINRWQHLGFLDLIDDEKKKEQIAVTYDNITNDLIYENERVVKICNRYNFNCTKDDENAVICEFPVIVFPLIRRIICKTDNFTYDKFLDYLEKFSFLAINYDGYEGNCDIEAEFCALLSLAIENSFNNEIK